MSRFYGMISWVCLLFSIHLELVLPQIGFMFHVHDSCSLFLMFACLAYMQTWKKRGNFCCLLHTYCKYLMNKVFAICEIHGDLLKGWNSFHSSLLWCENNFFESKISKKKRSPFIVLQRTISGTTAARNKLGWGALLRDTLPWQFVI